MTPMPYKTLDWHDTMSLTENKSSEVINMNDRWFILEIKPQDSAATLLQSAYNNSATAEK